MAPPPPPPPPPPPTSLLTSSMKSPNPVASKSSSSSSASSAPAAAKPLEINALLSEIRLGTRLKKVNQVNDRSAPLVAGNNSSSNKTADTGPVTPSMVKSGTGGLNIAMALKQAQQSGKPLLKKTNTNSIKLPNQSSPASNKSTPNKFTTPNYSSKNTSMRSDNGSPNESPTISTLRDLNKQPLSPKLTQNLPAKPIPATKPSIERPTVKPPPLPQKPPAINRRQSFDSGQLADARKPSHSYLTNNANQEPETASFNYSSATLKPTGSKPAPPPRVSTNSKSTSGLNTTLNYNSQTLRPAPRPPVVSSDSNSGKCKSVQNLTSGLAPAPSRPMKPQCPPPPPPPSKSSSTASPAYPLTPNRSFGQLSTASSSVLPSSPAAAPVPPLRVTSVSSNTQKSGFGSISLKSTLESRFAQSFKSINQMPLPDPFTKVKKHYPAVNQSKRRNPAPHPPSHSSLNDDLQAFKTNSALLNV